MSGTDLRECKWESSAPPGRVEQELEGKVREFPNPRGATIERRIFVKHPPPEGAGGGVGGVVWVRRLQFHR
jgi:hypothetical protein